MPQAKVIIITGASRGIGLAAARHLISEGHNVVAVARSAQLLEQLRLESPVDVLTISADLSDLKAGQKVVEASLEKWQRIDGIVVNHGILDPIKRIGDSTAEEWRASFDTNVFSGIALVQAALPALRKSKGKIIFTSSGAAVGAYATWGAYGASKAVLNHVAMTLAVEEPDVTTVSVRPGTVDTEMQRELREVHHGTMDEKDVKKFASLHADGKLLRPDQPGEVIAKLAVNAPRYVSGKFLNWNDEALHAFQENK